MKDRNNNDYEGVKLYCPKCKFRYPNLKKKLTHCNKCEVCVVEIDHHCSVFQKCIASKFKWLFILVIYDVFALTIYFFGSFIYLLIRYTGLDSNI